jgi:ABC-2 type transport system permease protein
VTAPAAPAPAPAAGPAAAPAVASAAAHRASPVTLSWVAVLLLGAALAFGNAALGRTNARLDLTQDRLYTLSDATRKVVSELTDPLRIRVYWGEKIPTAAQPVRRRLEGLLDEYVAASDGKVSATWVKMDEAGEREAQEKNVYEGTFQAFSANELSAVKAFHGLAVLYEDKVETVGPLAETDGQTYQISSGLEYDLTRAIYKVSRTNKAVVGVVSEASGPAFRNPHGGDRYSVLTSQVLEKVYGNDLRTSLNLDDPVPPEVTTLLVLEPKDWSDKRVYNLDQFLMRGGKVFLLLDTVDVRVAWGGQPQAKTGLEDWLKSFGVELPSGVLADYDPTAMGAALTQEGRGTKYPYWPRLRADQIDQSNPGTRGIDSVPLYFPIEILADAKAQEAAGRTLHVLATTSAKGWRKDSATGLQTVEEPSGASLAKHPVMISLEGPFTSFWKGKPAPGEPPPAPPPAATPAMAETPAAPAMEEAPAMSGAPPAPPPAMGEPPPPAPPAMGEPPAMGPDGPKGPEGPEGEAAAPGAAPAKEPKAPRLDQGKGVLVILGDSDLVSDDFSGVPRRDITGGATSYWNGVQGFFFVSNVVDWLTGSDDLISLRARGGRTRKFDEVDAAKADQIKVVNYVAAPILVLLGGLFVYFVRKHRK